MGPCTESYGTTSVARCLSRGAPVFSCERSRTRELTTLPNTRTRAYTPSFLFSLSIFLQLLGGPRHIPLCHFEGTTPTKDRGGEKERGREKVDPQRVDRNLGAGLAN